LKIHGLAQNWPQGLLQISSSTDALFRERSHFPHAPRTPSKHPLNVRLKYISCIHFYDILAPKIPATLNNNPPRAAKLISKANHHPCFLGILGILPNQLRTLLKESGHDRREEALLDISRTLFFAGFRIWTKRQSLNSTYWNEIAPENKNFKTVKRKKRRLDAATSQSKCTNPFHFLVRHSNLSLQRPTKCPCRNVSSRATVYKTQSMTEFIFKFPQVVVHETSSSDPFQLPRSTTNNKVGTYQLLRSFTDNKDFSTRADAIRREHDRGKNNIAIILVLS